MCEVLEISKSNYYKYKDFEDSDYSDYRIIKKIFDKSRRTYGYRRITYELKDKGIIMNHKKVLRIMSKYGLIPGYVRRFRNYSKEYRKENVRGNICLLYTSL